MTEPLEPGRDIARLIGIMAALRTPGTGCPWDLAQTFASIAPYTIEEAYEVADAIQRGDLADLRDELGDLLLQVVYHARLAEEQSVFDFGDVVMGVTAKMIRRHPHVFGDVTAKSAGAVKDLWDEIKRQERAGKPHANAGVLSDVPIALPALTRAIKLQHKAAKVGFDWPSLAPVFDKMREELAELEAEVSKSAPSGRMMLAPSYCPSDSRPEGAGVLAAASGRLRGAESDAAVKAAMKEEFGDLLFVMANVARHLNIDPEDALRAANEKFTRRFAHIEARLGEQGLHPAQSTLDEMDALWDEAKTMERSSD